jgi:hypothetical protein
VRWFKDNKLIEESERVSFVNDDDETGTYALVISEASLAADDGQYHATAANANGEVIAAFSLIISAPLSP